MYLGSTIVLVPGGCTHGFNRDFAGRGRDCLGFLISYRRINCAMRLIAFYTVFYAVFVGMTVMLLAVASHPRDEQLYVTSRLKPPISSFQANKGMTYILRVDSLRLTCQSHCKRGSTWRYLRVVEYAE
ncbi:hypothetical protein L596_001365 [Steinernema carpocapsae]|uniref:Uncharacterized protein n=1 Tax=Steinernema carpocapsae TaxID=34508 RepID=A0A4U8UNJ5_STECR|nr:hypothetical protein L596_001365 [Steinernema carpocapsae]